MSIIMATRNLPPVTANQQPLVDERLMPLLDHIASELAHEYVRLMEDAAAAESADDHTRRKEVLQA